MFAISNSVHKSEKALMYLWLKWYIVKKVKILIRHKMTAGAWMDVATFSPVAN